MRGTGSNHHPSQQAISTGSPRHDTDDFAEKCFGMGGWRLGWGRSLDGCGLVTLNVMNSYKLRRGLQVLVLFGP